MGTFTSLLYFESSRRLRTAFLVAIIMAVYITLTYWTWTPFRGSAEKFEELYRMVPEEYMKIFTKGVITVFNFDIFYLTEFHVLMYAILGMYFAYTAANSIVGELEGRTVWLHFSTPLSRYYMIIAKYLSIAVSAAIISAATLAIVYIGSLVFDEQLNGEAYAKLYMVGVLFLLSSASLGMLLGTVTLSRRAPMVSAFLMIAMHLLDTISIGTDYEALGYITLTRYYDSMGILVDNTVNFTHIMVLIVVTLAFLISAMLVFNKKDVIF